MSILLIPLPLAQILRFPVLLALLPLAFRFLALSALHLLQLRPVLSFLRLFQLPVLLSQALLLQVLLTVHPVLISQSQDLPFLFLRLPLTLLSIWLLLFRLHLR